MIQNWCPELQWLMQEVVRHGRNTTIPVLPDPHATRRWLTTLKVPTIFLIASSGSNRGQHVHGNIHRGPGTYIQQYAPGIYLVFFSGEVHIANTRYLVEMKVCICVFICSGEVHIVNIRNAITKIRTYHVKKRGMKPLSLSMYHTRRVFLFFFLRLRCPRLSHGILW